MSGKVESPPQHAERVFANRPRIWIINSNRVGENAQIRALAAALGEAFVEKKIVYRFWSSYMVGARRVGLAGIDKDASSALEPPWPRLLISAGGRNEPVVRWLKRASNAQVRTVFLGRTWSNYDHFDLIVTTPQYRLPKRPNVLHNSKTLHGLPPKNLRPSTRWRALEAMPRPRILALIGGRSGTSLFGPRAARRLAGDLNQLVERHGGSVIASTSARTNARCGQLFEDVLRAPALIYHYRHDDADNPYGDFLSAADRIIVTSDSISMIGDATATGKPVSIFDLQAGRPQAAGRGAGARVLGRDRNLATMAYGMLETFGPRRLVRDISLAHKAIIDSGQADWFHVDAPVPEPPPTQARELENTVRRVRQLLDQDCMPAGSED